MKINGVESKPVPGLEDIYASADGRIWTSRPKNGKGDSVTPRQMNHTSDRKGYSVVSFKKKPQKRFVHQLVLETFVGPRPVGYVTRHINGDPADNRLCNIEWETQSVNHGDKVVHGTHNRGSRHSLSKLTEEDIIDIRLESCSHLESARKYGVSRQTIQRIKTGKRWRHV